MRTRIKVGFALLSGAVLAVTVAAGIGLARNEESGGPNPAKFRGPAAANPYFPLEPGFKAQYRGEEGGEGFVEHLKVTHQTKEIQGVTTTVVHDVVRSHGRPVEVTDDWYAADVDGNVWYFGEATAEYNKKGEIITTEGSWEAGVNGAVAGIIMPADPMPTDAYRQEFYPGHAEDQGWIVQRGFKVKVAYGRISDALRSFEWARIEPRVMTQKIYGPGLGIVSERIIAGGDETLELVSVETPS